MAIGLVTRRVLSFPLSYFLHHANFLPSVRLGLGLSTTVTYAPPLPLMKGSVVPHPLPFVVFALEAQRLHKLFFFFLSLLCWWIIEER